MEQNIEMIVTEADVKRKGGDRGTVGKPTVALTIKQRWHRWHRYLKENKAEPGSRAYLSLKQFARGQMKSDDGLAKTWFDHKHGSLNAKRNEANVKTAREARSATHTARRKKKNEGSK